MLFFFEYSTSLPRGLFCLALFAIPPASKGAWAEDANGAANGAAKTQSKIAIGKETSRITEPLDAEGYPDYVAAINETSERRGYERQ